MKKMIMLTSIFSFLVLLMIGESVFAGPPKKIIDAFTFCFDNKDTDIENLINIEGYYKERILLKRSNVVGSFLNKDSIGLYADSGFISIIFYKNGLFKYDFFCLKAALLNENSEEAKSFYDGQWGRYSIDGDIIKTQFIYKPSKGELSKWKGTEIWYKVINRTTIKIVKIDALSTNTEDKNNLALHKKVHEERMKTLIVFVPDKLPNYLNAWILKENWFWCNENDRKTFLKKKNTER
ncbi:hypothetical protein [Dysgonomonas sp. ZJ279]|uniref:hypothetical protein n=1 Tax=Dysgonomonas sp. ZJ279 TaxID=2709796 RepID=UPI0013EE2061|nr:hypothetical protein [Dysgonomonas sp. ZJ279]